jgi:anti-anti-sigma factor
VTALADLELETHSGQPVARLRGELDASNAARLATPIYEFVSNHEPGLVVDLTDIRYLDSAGVRLLFELAGRLDRRQLELHVVAAEDTHVSEVLDVVAIQDVARVHPSLPEALAALAGR